MSNLIDNPYPVSLAPTLEPLLPTSSSSSQSQAHQSGAPEQGAPKKKRSRITREQLAHLERLFAMDCSPTAARRREISLQMAVPERQIQIWFQNRRAKARNNGERNKTRPRVTFPLGHPPELSQAIQTELAAFIQEDDPIFIIPCTSLTIGRWNRVNYDSQQDLLAWVCEKKRCLTWFVRSKEYGFKMQVPLDYVAELEFTNANPGQGFLTVDLSQPPEFFLRAIQPKDDGVSSGWRLCNDWTEDKEASRIMRHVLGGAALPLAYIVDYIKSHTATTQAAPAHPQCTSYPANKSWPSTVPTPSRPPPNTSYNCYALTERQSMPLGWDSTSPTQYPMGIKPPLGAYQNHNIPPPPEALGLNGLGGCPDSQLCHDLTRFTPVDTLSNASPNLPSSLLVPLKPSYPYPQTPSTECHTSHSLPGLSELFVPVKNFQ